MRRKDVLADVKPMQHTVILAYVFLRRRARDAFWRKVFSEDVRKIEFGARNFRKT